MCWAALLMTSELRGAGAITNFQETNRDFWRHYTDQTKNGDIFLLYMILQSDARCKF